MKSEAEESIEDVWRDILPPPGLIPKVYFGGRSQSNGQAFVKVRLYDKVEPLPLYIDVVRHSPDGFEWGFSGSGPAQLACAILCDHFGGGTNGAQRALQLYQYFKTECVAHLPFEGWEMSNADVRKVVQTIESKIKDPQ